jgi:hypothetical protein
MSALGPKRAAQDQSAKSVGLSGSLLVALVGGFLWVAAALVLPSGSASVAQAVISVSGSLPDGNVGAAYSPAPLQISGGIPPYTITAGVSSQGDCSNGARGTLANTGVTATVVGSQIVFAGTPTQAGGFSTYFAVYDKGCLDSSSLLHYSAEFFDTSVTTASIVPLPGPENYYDYDTDNRCCSLKAVVSSGHPSSGSPPGSVSFFVDGVPEGKGVLNYSPYNNPKPTTVTILSATNIAAGSHTLKAVFNNDSVSAGGGCFNLLQGETKNCFLQSSGTTSFTVSPTPTLIMFSNTALPVQGKPWFSTQFYLRNDPDKLRRCCAQVDPGTVVQLLMDGAVVDTAKVLSNAAGAAPPELSVKVPPGHHTFVVKYVGDANELPSESAPLTADVPQSTGPGTNSAPTPVTNAAPEPLTLQPTQRQCDAPTMSVPADYQAASDHYFSGGFWRIEAYVSPDSGLVLRNVRLGYRYMALHMSLPFFTWIADPVIQGHLTPDSDAEYGRTRLIGLGSAASHSGVNLIARYVVDRLPRGTKNCIIITQQYLFLRPPNAYVPPLLPATSRCEPFGVVSCARFYPVVHYVYFKDPTHPIHDFLLKTDQEFRFDVDGRRTDSAIVARDVDGMVNQALNGPWPIVVEQSNPLTTAASFVALDDGKPGLVDNYHQGWEGEIQEPVALKPGCPECVHVHWRWSTNLDSPLVTAVVGGPYPQFGGGAPIIPKGSHQTVVIRISSSAGSRLVNTLPIFSYVASSSAASDTFFAHGGWFAPNADGSPLPLKKPAK